MDLPVWSAVASAIAAWVAAWYAFGSARIARKSYELALQQEQRRRPALELYLLNAHIRRFMTQQCRIYIFDLEITNKSESDNSVRDIRLHIEHRRGQGPSSNLTISHDPSASAGNLLGDTVILDPAKACVGA